DMPRAADRALRLSHPRLPHHRGWPLPGLRHADPRPLECEVRRTDRVAAFHPGQPPVYNPQLPMKDLLGRPLRNLRLSVTDRCNLRCEYCMPEEDYVWLPRQDVLHFEEICALVDVFLSLGVDKIRLTGGEPLLRRDLASLVAVIARNAGLNDLALTTNGILLSDQIDAIAAAGLGRITVSLDTLQRDRFIKLTRFDQLDAVHRGIASAQRVFGRLKIDTVVIRGVNDDEIVALVEYGRTVNAEVRFIEYMDVGGASRWSPDRVFSRGEMLAALSARFGRIVPIATESWA